MFDYSNICYWKDLSSRPNDHPPRTSLHVHQLACRALIQTVSPTPSPHTNPGILPGTTHDVEHDTMASCKSFISAAYERTGHRKATGSVLDAYDVVSIAVVYGCLSKRDGASSDRRRAELTEVLHKASTLVTQISARFPALGDFHRLFLVLSSKVTGNEVYIDLSHLHSVNPDSLERVVC